jgi:hypothetical protein
MLRNLTCLSGTADRVKKSIHLKPAGVAAVPPKLYRLSHLDQQKKYEHGDHKNGEGRTRNLAIR